MLQQTGTLVEREQWVYNMGLWQWHQEEEDGQQALVLWQ
jgi:hypothetical protein